MEDDDLRAGLRSGDLDRAFRALRERHGAAIYRVCLGVLHDPAAAEDAMQDTFIKAYDERARLAAAGSIQGYILKMARNTALDAQRRTSRRARIGFGPPPDPTAAVTSERAGEPEPAELTALTECLDELDSTTRTALDLWREGVPWPDIATTVDLPADAIRMRVKRALATLRRCIEKKKVGRT